MPSERFPARNFLPRLRGVVVTPTSLVVEGDLSYASWDRLLSDLARFQNRARWWIGDLLVAGEVRYGETYSEAEKLTGLKRQTLKHYKRIAERVAPERRRAGLTWSHHRRVEQLVDEEQERWLDLAARNRWTAQELEAEMLASSDAQPETFPDPEAGDDAPRCPACDGALDARTIDRLRAAGMLPAQVPELHAVSA